MHTGKHSSSEAVCLFERLICGCDCSDCEVGHTADFTTCDHCPAVNTESRACLDHLTKWSTIMTSSTADRDHWSWSAAPPSVAQYAKLPEWATVLAVSHQCGWTARRPVERERSWLRFGVIYSPTLAVATDSLLPTFPLSPCGVKPCAAGVTTATQTVQRGSVGALIIAVPACICARYRLISGRRNIARSASLLPQCCLTWLFEQPVSDFSIWGSNYSNEHWFTEPRFTTLLNCYCYGVM